MSLTAEVKGPKPVMGSVASFRASSTAALRRGPGGIRLSRICCGDGRRRESDGDEGSDLVEHSAVEYVF